MNCQPKKYMSRYHKIDCYALHTSITFNNVNNGEKNNNKKLITQPCNFRGRGNYKSVINSSTFWRKCSLSTIMVNFPRRQRRTKFYEVRHLLKRQLWYYKNFIHLHGISKIECSDIHFDPSISLFSHSW